LCHFVTEVAGYFAYLLRLCIDLSDSARRMLDGFVFVGVPTVPLGFQGKDGLTNNSEFEKLNYEKVHRIEKLQHICSACGSMGYT